MLRNRGVAAVAVMAVALLVEASAQATSNVVRVRVTPATVRAGGPVFISAVVRPFGGRCTATIRTPGFAAKRLVAKQAVGGVVAWRSSVPRAARTGTGTATVTCAGAGRGTARFSVRALPPPPTPTIPARVAVVRSGIASRLSSIGSTFAGYGVVLQNLSPDEDALSVDVVVNILDAGGLILKTETDTYAAIPAGVTYYAGGDSIFQGTPARLEITVRVRERQRKSIPALPTVSNVRVQDNVFGEAQVLGEVANPYTRALSSLARITYACLDASGNVIGGGFTFVGTDLPPGARIGFQSSVDGLTAAQIASVQVSVEPEVE